MSKLTETKLTITGISKKVYQFIIYPIDTKFYPVGGVYIFTKRDKRGYQYHHELIYCGKTKDLSTRFDHHHKEDDINEHDANCICVMRVNTEKERTLIEEDILANNNFVCNEILN